MSSLHTLDPISDVMQIPTLDGIREFLYGYLNHLGFEYFACADIPRSRERLTDVWLIDRWPPEWAARYAARNYIVRDPMVIELYRRILPFSWADVNDPHVHNAEDLRIVREASEFGMQDGFVIPIHHLDGRIAVFTMAGAQSCLDDGRARRALHLLCLYAHARMRELKPLSTPSVTHPLSERERECLHWTGNGKTSWEIGEILGVGESTVRKHIESAKAKLGVSSKTQAVIAAMRSGEVCL